MSNLVVVEFKLPDLGEGIHEAEVLDIRVKEGEMVKEDQILFEVETDKAAVEVPSPFSGTVEKVFVKVGDTAKVGNVIITFKVASDKPAEAPAPAPVGGREQGAAAGQHAAGGNGKTVASAGTNAPAVRPAPGSGPVPATPATRRLAREMSIDLRLIQGSGPGGRVIKEDVRAFAEGVPAAARGTATGAPSPTAAGGAAKQAVHGPGLSVAAKYGGDRPDASGGGPLTLQPVALPDFSKHGRIERVPLRSLRRKIAINMAQSWSHVPHVSNFDEADITDLETARQRHEQAVAKQGGRLTLTAIALKAVVSGLKKYPQFNCSLDETTSELVFKHYYNIGVAVATERGLIVPVIRDVDQKNLVELSIELAEVAQKTRDGKIELDRLQGGTFTITNIGPIGGTGMVPMVNYPEVGIMGMARSKEQPVVRNCQIVIRTIMPLALSFDHRVADGAEAAMFLRHIASCLEDPFQLLLEG